MVVFSSASVNSFALACLAVGATASVLPALAHVRRGDTPGLPTDPLTTKYCTWWFDNEGSMDCATVVSAYDLQIADFMRWNPSITASCGGFETGKSYCVEALNEPSAGVTSTVAPSTSSSIKTSTITSSSIKSSTTSSAIKTSTFTSSSIKTSKTSSAAPSTTSPSNGIATPQPIQPGMVSNCDAFYFTKSGDNCKAIANAKGITVTQFITWNPQVGGTTCTGLWVDVNVCVSIIGHTPTTTTASPTNGIATPTPTQPGMVSNCDLFYLTKTGDSCASIAAAKGITVAQFTTWNTQVGGTACTGLWVGVNVCISIVGHTPTTTTPGNGIATPTPTQPGMVSNCDLFYLTKTGDTCASVAAAKGITVAQFTTWNTQVGGTACTGLWVGVNVCISIVGHTPTTTTPGHGVATPTPIQTGMVTNCKMFYLVVAGDTCATIAAKKSITAANFIKWNPAVKSDCTGLWTNTYACIAVL